jgi:hypothetical protein
MNEQIVSINLFQADAPCSKTKQIICGVLLFLLFYECGVLLPKLHLDLIIHPETRNAQPSLRPKVPDMEGHSSAAIKVMSVGNFPSPNHPLNSTAEEEVPMLNQWTPETTGGNSTKAVSIPLRRWRTQASGYNQDK